MTLSIGKAVTDIRIPLKISDQHDLVQCLSVRKKLIKFARSIENNFTIIIFWVTLYNIVSLFSAFIVPFGLTKTPTLIATCESSLIFITCFSSFLGTVLCASKVPKAFAELRKSLRDLYQNSSYKLGNQKRSLTLLQSVIGEEEFYFTAWGFINLNKSLILSALGALVTYGILLVQFKLPSESI
ncbi:hypothetical protein CEXT_764861 [Caerostris extrusa]|uniref:Uncharacterized protein n=1 Tax=Caerostris extrusa TaxID=172846 RepID=A0AAV4XKW1_CAEEX|nr:hypothetical protein CEXT_764861 [Caerostris extrusa]